MKVMFIQYLGTLIRNLVLPLLAGAFAGGYVTEADIVNLIGAVVPVIISVVWGLLNKYVWKDTVSIAIDAPSGSTTLDEIVRGGR